MTPSAARSAAAAGDEADGRLSGTVAALSLIVAYSALPLLGPESSTVSSVAMWWSDLFKWGIMALLLLVVVLWEGRGLRSVGLRRPRLTEIGVGLAAGAGCLLLLEGVETFVFEPAGWSVTGSAVGSLQSLSAIQRVSVVASAAVAEEFLYRGVLMERVEELTGRAWPAVAATVVLFVAGHMALFGPATNVAQTLVTLLLAGLYLWRRDLTAPIVVHAVIDGWGLLLVPALGL